MSLNPAYISNRDDIIKFIFAQPKKILDVGCSNGALGRKLKAFFPHSYVVGIEHDKVMAQLATAHLDRVIAEDLDGTAWKNEIQDEMFDLIICADVLEHTKRPDIILSELTKHLDHQGKIIISLPNIRHWSAIFQIAVLGDWPERNSGIFDRTHLRFFTRQSAIRFITNAGLQLQQVVGKYPFYDDRKGTLHAIGCTLAALPTAREFISYQYILICRPFNQL